MVVKDSVAFFNTHSKWSTSISFVGILLRILLGFFALMMTGLALKEYQSERTMTTVQVEYKESMKLPAATVCLPLNFGELSKCLSNKTNKYYTSALTEYSKAQNLTKNKFLPNDGVWDDSVRNVVHAYLIDLSLYEVGCDSECSPVSAGDEDLASAESILEKLMSTLNISIDELRQKFGEEVAELYSVRISLHHFIEFIGQIKDMRLNYIDKVRICFEADFNNYPLKMASYFGISVSEKALPCASTHGFNRGFIAVYFENIITSGFKDKFHINPYFDAVVYYTMELTQYRMLPEMNDVRVCISDQLLEECEAACRIKFIQERCNCLPTSWPSLLKDFNIVSNLQISLLVSHMLKLERKSYNVRKKFSDTIDE